MMSAAKRRVTKSRAWGWSTGGETGISFEHGWVAGAYVLRVNGSTVAQCTDRWMAQLILDALMRVPIQGAPKEIK